MTHELIFVLLLCCGIISVAILLLAWSIMHAGKESDYTRETRPVLEYPYCELQCDYCGANGCQHRFGYNE